MTSHFERKCAKYHRKNHANFLKAYSCIFFYLFSIRTFPGRLVNSCVLFRGLNIAVIVIYLNAIVFVTLSCLPFSCDCDISYWKISFN